MKPPISQTIRDRLKTAKHRFHANDNIAEHIKPGELDSLQAEVQANVQTLLDSLIIDTENDHNSQESAKRIAKMYLHEIFKGRYHQPPEHTFFPNCEQLDEIYTVGPLAIRSTCSHHFAPITGQVWIGVLPNEKIIGLSKFSRIVAWFLSRPHIQEEASIKLADYFEKILQPRGLGLVIKAHHMCMSWRGVQEPDASMVTTVLRGSILKDASKKKEFYDMIAAQGFK